MLSFQNPQKLIAYQSGMRLAGMVTKVKRSRSMYPEDTWTNGQQIGCSNTEQFHEARKTVNKIILTQSALMFSSSHCVPCVCMCVCVCSVYISCRSILGGDPAGFFFFKSRVSTGAVIS